MSLSMRSPLQRVLLGLSSMTLLIGLPAQASSLVVNGNFTAGAPGGVTGAGYQATTGSPGGWSVEVPGGTSTTNVLDCVVTGGANVVGATANVCGHAENQNWGFNYAVSSVPTNSNFPTGGNFFAMDGGTGYQGPLYQTISGLTVGQNYTLTFDAATDQQYNFSPIISAYWGVAFYNSSLGAPSTTLTGGTTTYHDTAAITETTTAQAWTLETFNFTATSASETLAFLAGSSVGASDPPFALLSDVSLTATPEPGTFVLLGLGLLSIPAARKFRKKGL
jgi:hypothetical protein